MKTDTTYNGWSNYETWNVKLWMDNDEGSYHYWQEQAEQALSRDEDEAADRLADQLESEHRESISALLDGSGWATDIMTGAFGQIDWKEIAESLVADAKEALSE